MRDKPIFSSEMLCKDYDSKSSLADENCGRDPQEAWH
jgi:hypothetical protein